MLNKHRALIIFFLILLSSTTLGYSRTQTPNILKIALLDSPYGEMPFLPVLSEYGKAYEKASFAGVETAARAAKKYNIEIKFKSFFYGLGALDILGELPKVQQWQADLVLGPCSSDQFLLLRNHLPNVMVLSGYASADALQSLPENFYSTLLPDSSIMELLAHFIKNKFPKKNIYLIAQVDCKQCVDVSKLFINYYKKISPYTKIVENKLIMDNIGSIDSKKLMQGHHEDITLVFNNAYYAYNTFVNHVTAAFPGEKLTFFSDQDNWSHEVDGNPYHLDLSFESYRIGPVLFDGNSIEFKNFSKTYYEIYHKKPTEAISYLIYVTVMSAVEALHQFPTNQVNQNMREHVLHSYLAALHKNPHWFRSRAYGIYQLTSKGEVLLAKLPVSTRTAFLADAKK